jgi:hypothetical protein
MLAGSLELRRGRGCCGLRRGHNSAPQVGEPAAPGAAARHPNTLLPRRGEPSCRFRDLGAAARARRPMRHGRWRSVPSARAPERRASHSRRSEGPGNIAGAPRQEHQQERAQAAAAAAVRAPLSAGDAAALAAAAAIRRGGGGGAGMVAAAQAGQRAGGERRARGLAGGAAGGGLRHRQAQGRGERRRVGRCAGSIGRGGCGASLPWGAPNPHCRQHSQAAADTRTAPPPCRRRSASSLTSCSWTAPTSSAG